MTRFAFYCKCGASWKGSAPDSSPVALKSLWLAVHSGPACGPTTPIPKYPNVKVQLSGTDGIRAMGKVKWALRASGHADEVGAFIDEAMSGDHDHVLQTCKAWVTVS